MLAIYSIVISAVSDSTFLLPVVLRAGFSVLWPSPVHWMWRSIGQMFNMLLILKILWLRQGYNEGSYFPFISLYGCVAQVTF